MLYNSRHVVSMIIMIIIMMIILIQSIYKAHFKTKCFTEPNNIRKK